MPRLPQMSVVLVDVLFGFERTELEVSEAAGDFDICVVVFNPGQSDDLEATISFMIVSQPGTAGLESLNQHHQTTSPIVIFYVLYVLGSCRFQ